MYFIRKYRRGIWNKYRRGMPVIEMLIKDIRFSFHRLQNFLVHGYSTPLIVCLPHFPSRRSALYKLCRYKKYNITNKPSSNADVAVYYDYNNDRKEYYLLDPYIGKIPTINYKSRDISKKNVDKNFKETFGYSSFVNPFTYKGPCVKKNDVNAMHDGTIIQCPVDHKDEAFVYQIALDNLAENGMHEDVRIPVIGGEIPLVFLQYRPQHDRFRTAIEGKIRETEEILSQWEIDQIKTLTKKMNLDFGEMDAIRHKQDGKLYIIDINDTPSSRARLFPGKTFEIFLKRQGRIFEKIFLRKN